MQRMQRWYPFNDFWTTHYAQDRIRLRFVQDSGSATNGSAARTWAVPLDVATKGEDTIVRASLPGVAPEDIQVSIEDRVLTIKGQTDEKFEDSDGQFVMRERRTGAFSRALRLPDSVDPDKVQTALRARRPDHHPAQGGSQAGSPASNPCGCGAGRRRFLIPSAGQSRPGADGSWTTQAKTSPSDCWERSFLFGRVIAANPQRETPEAGRRGLIGKS